MPERRPRPSFDDGPIAHHEALTVSTFWSCWPLGLVGGATLAVGIGLRLNQIRSQVLIQDEWHSVNKIVDSGLHGILLSFGTLDHSIPVTVAYWLIAQTVGLSELLMRLPMLTCGIAMLLALPAMVWRPLGPRVALVFGMFLATCPLLITYSRMARPYIVALLLVYAAHWAFHRWWPGGRRSRAGVVYAVCAGLSTWLLPVFGPVAFAPLLWGGARLLRLAPPERGRVLRRWLILALGSGVPTASLTLLPLALDPMAMSLRTGYHVPNWETVIGVGYLWLGTRNTSVVLLCVLAAVTGAGMVWRRWRSITSTLGLGLAFTVVLILVTRPAFVMYPLAFGRYMLVGLPLLMLCMAAGVVQCGHVAARLIGGPSWLRQAVSLAPASAVLAVWLLSSTLWATLPRPTQYSLHGAFHIVPQPAFDMVRVIEAQLPVSPLWYRLGRQPAEKLNVAVAPWHFASLGFDAPRWQRVSQQTIVPGFVSDLCVPSRLGEVPASPRFQFRNAVHLSSPADLEAKAIDVIVYLQPYRVRWEGIEYPLGDDLAHCEPVLRERFGPPGYGDHQLLAFGLSRRGREILAGGP